MSKELNQLKPNMLTISGTEAENILGAAQEEAGFEKLLKFKKSEYLTGDEVVSLGTEYIAHVVGWTKCWVKFVDGEVADRKTYRVAYGERPPEREALDDLDRDKWPEGLDGSPADPWVYQYLLPLEHLASGEDRHFCDLFGRRPPRRCRSLFDLRKPVGKNASCGQPIIKLAKVDMPTKKFGKVPRPQFEIVGWDEPAGDVNENAARRHL